MKYAQLNCKMNSYSEDTNSNLMKVKIVVMHDGTNLKGTKFSIDSMKKAEKTIKNIPILGHVTRDSYGDLDDFDGHNMETRIIDSDKGFDVETYYIEKPIGVVPESCNPRYEEVDGYTYLVVDGYVWKSYSNGAYKLIANNEFKGVSMEISVQDGRYDENDYSYEILDYQYEGITVLGDHVPAAMGEHTKISKYSKCADYKKALEEICNEIYALESEVNTMENEIVETETKEEVVEDVIDKTDDVEEIKEENTVASIEDIENNIVTTNEDEEDKSTVEITDESTDVEVEENENPLDVFSILFDEVPGSLQEIAVRLHKKFEAINSELTDLRRFKSEKDNEELVEQINNITSEFSELTKEDVQVFKEKAVSREITLEGYREKLASLAYVKIKANKDNYSYQPKQVIVPIIEKNEENGYEPYGGLFK